MAPVTQLVAAAETAQLASAQASAAAPVSADIFVGRADGMARLESAFARVHKGEGSISALIGEPGIGKTRLAEAAEQSAPRTGARTAWGRFQPSSGAPPLWAFAQVLRELDSGELAHELLSTMRDQPAPPSERAVEPASQDGAPLWGLTSESLQDAVNTSHRALDRIAQALLALARQTPLVILLDDLQWADAASLRLLSYVAGDIARWPIAIVATQRSGEQLDGRRHGPELLRLLTHRNCERIELRRLGEHDVAEYCGALFGTPTEALCRAVFTRSEGNPFFMVELLRPWSGVGTGPMPEQLGLSEFALDPMRQRLQHLPAVSRQVLSAAAVIGHDFDLGLLGQVTQRGSDELLEALDGSLANDTVVPSNEMVGGYSFDHELIRELLYDELSVSERSRLHLRTGESLLLRRAAGHEVASAELAQHFLAALPQGDVSTAIEHARAGAAAAYRLGSLADARVLLRGALEALQLVVNAPVETRTELLLELAMVERTSGDSNYRAHLTQGVALAREHRLGALLALAGRLLTPAPGLMVDAQACEVLEAALEVLPPSDAKRRAIVLAHLAWTPPHSRSARKVAALLDEAAQLAERTDDHDARLAVRGARIYFSGGPATQAEAATLSDQLQRDLPARRQRRPRG